jgi:hypothetical protein
VLVLVLVLELVLLLLLVQVVESKAGAAGRHHHGRDPRHHGNRVHGGAVVMGSLVVVV